MSARPEATTASAVAAQSEDSAWPLVLCVAAVIAVIAAVIVWKRSRAAAAPDAKAETAVDAEAGKGKDRVEVEVEVVASPLGNVA